MIMVIQFSHLHTITAKDRNLTYSGVTEEDEALGVEAIWCGGHLVWRPLLTVVIV
jgi:hypothetical protein